VKRLIALITLLMLSLPLVYAASTTYYAKTTVYFNIPSDATFSIAMPSDYASWPPITGTTEAEATATDWISFNFTSGTANSTLVEPYQLGAAANTQSGTQKPIMYIDNTGNVNIVLAINGTAPPTGIQMFFNGTGGTSPLTDLKQMTGTGYVDLMNSMTNTEFFNLTLWANVTGEGSHGQTSIDIYLRSTAV